MSFSKSSAVVLASMGAGLHVGTGIIAPSSLVLGLGSEGVATLAEVMWRALEHQLD